jgi:hypothetical protein
MLFEAKHLTSATKSSDQIPDVKQDVAQVDPTRRMTVVSGDIFFFLSGGVRAGGYYGCGFTVMRSPIAGFTSIAIFAYSSSKPLFCICSGKGAPLPRIRHVEIDDLNCIGSDRLGNCHPRRSLGSRFVLAAGINSARLYRSPQSRLPRRRPPVRSSQLLMRSNCSFRSQGLPAL